MSHEPLYFDDLRVGDTFKTATHALDADQIKAFAQQFDPQPFHLDDGAARQSIFGGLAASGWHTAAITMRLLVTSGLPLANGILGAGAKVEWKSPTRPGDVLHVESEVLSLTAVAFSAGSRRCRDALPDAQSARGSRADAYRNADGSAALHLKNVRPARSGHRVCGCLKLRMHHGMRTSRNGPANRMEAAAMAARRGLVPDPTSTTSLRDWSMSETGVTNPFYARFADQVEILAEASP